MAQIIDRLASLHVVDVMATDVMVVGANQTMAEVARLLADNHVSSAPVVDECGHCVGVITATDFVKRETALAGSTESQFIDNNLSQLDNSQPWRCVPVNGDYVSQHMNPAVQAIDPRASLLRASRVMCAQHIHRLLVIDDKNHPVGVISTMDVVAALVNVVDEMESQTNQSTPD